MVDGLRKIKKATMAELIIEQIMQMIDEGTFTPGQKLPSETELAAMFSVSRPSLREAMRSLMVMGIVEIRCGDGTYLNDSANMLSEYFKNSYRLTKYSINELIDTRVLLETQMAASAATNATAEDIRFMRKAQQKVKAAMELDPAEFHSADLAFHMCVANASGNRFIKEMLHAVEELLVLMNCSIPTGMDIRQQAINSHNRIIEAIAAKDCLRARNEMYQHILDTAYNVRVHYGCGQEEAAQAAEQ